MTFEEIYQYFDNPPPTYLSKELAVCYILEMLLRGESYGTELIEHLEKEYHHYRLSDTVLYSAVKFLEEEGMVTGYWKKAEGRGRPRRMYVLRPEGESKSIELAKFWQRFVAKFPHP